MKRILLLIASLPCALGAAAQFPPAAGQPGTTAIAADSSVLVAWATACMVERGPQDISNVALGPAGTGDESMAVGPAGTNGVVSLGDGGTAVLTFERPIANGPGWDFAVFENGVSDTFLELAFVEVSSNGTDYVRFPATSNTQDTLQIEGFGAVDATRIDNLAGKYRGGFGTPFDLDAVADAPELDVNAVTHVRLVDVVGCIQPAYATHDRYGHTVNDPWNTPFPSNGFDLDAVGVIHALSTGIPEGASAVKGALLYPNPADAFVHLRSDVQNAGPMAVTLCDATGRTLAQQPSVSVGRPATLDLSGLAEGTYVVRLSGGPIVITLLLLVHHAH